MDMSQLPQVVGTVLEILSFLFIFAIGVGVLLFAFFYIRDRTQTDSTLRRNYPVIARFRYLFEHLGEFFRQYFFALRPRGNAVQPRRALLGLSRGKRS